MKPTGRVSLYRFRGDGLLNRFKAAQIRAKQGTLALVVPILALAATSGISPAPASALYCSPNGGNYYGEACLYGKFRGMSGTIRSDALAPTSAQFVNNDMWIVNSTTVHFIEAGITNGTICTEDSENLETCYKKQSTVGPQFFWGDDRSGSRYYAHLGGSASLATAYGDKIYFKGSETWSVEVGSLSGTSSSNPLSANLIRTGTEEASTAAVACSEQYNLEWLDESNLWHSGWTNSTEEAALSQSEPPYAWWANKNHWVRDRSNEPTCYGI